MGDEDGEVGWVLMELFGVLATKKTRQGGRGDRRGAEGSPE